MSDSDSKLVAAVNPNFTRLSCSAHDLNLAVKHSINREGTGICTTVEQSKKLVQHFKRIKSDTSPLKTKLVQSVETRFNSIYHMLDSILRNWNEIVTVLTDRNELSWIYSINYSDLEWLSKILSSFDEATLKLAKSTSPTLHLVIPIYKSLLSKLQRYSYREQVPEAIKDLCRSLSSNVNQKCVEKLHDFWVNEVYLSNSATIDFLKSVSRKETFYIIDIA